MAFIVEYNLTPLLSAICLKPQFIREGVAAHTSWIHKQTGCNNYCSDFCSHTVSVFLNKHQTICVFTHIFSPKVRDNEGPVSINHRTGPSFTGQSNSNKSLDSSEKTVSYLTSLLLVSSQFQSFGCDTTLQDCSKSQFWHLFLFCGTSVCFLSTCRSSFLFSPPDWVSAYAGNGIPEIFMFVVYLAICCGLVQKRAPFIFCLCVCLGFFHL